MVYEKKNLKWRYRNISLVLLGIIVAIAFSKTESFNQFLLQMGSLGYFGAFIAGMLSVSTFTVAIGILILADLATYLNPWEIALIAGLGAVFSDFVIFKFVKDEVGDEVKDIYENIDTKHHLEKILHTRYFSWTLPVLGAVIIASPLPNELGVSLMGVSKMNSWYFLMISYVLNSIGIFSIVYIAALIR